MQNDDGLMTEAEDDARLIERMALKDEAALRAFFARRQLRVYRFARRLIEDGAGAEDLTNEVFLEAWRTAGDYDFQASAAAWLLGIAHRRIEAARERRVEDGWSSREEANAAGAAPGGGETPRARDDGGLARRMESLSAVHREIIDLVYYHEMSISETAAVLSVTEAAARERLFAARTRLVELARSNGADGKGP